MKLQDAYAAETGAVGTWGKIGYIGPGEKDANASIPTSNTTVFKYTDNFTGSGNTGTTIVDQLQDNSAAWQAEAKTALNDCKVTSKWTVKLSRGSSTSDGSLVKYTADAPTDDSCSGLTANFGNIGK